MTIKRNINGVKVEIELTPEELYQIYTEEQRQWDISDVKMAFDGMDAAEIADAYDMPWTEIEPLIPEMARRYRKYMDNDESWGHNRDEAIAYVLADHRMEMGI